MAITWGGWAMRDAYYGQRVGIDLSRSGNTFTAKYYVETKGSVYYNGLVLDRSGAIDGNVSFNWNTGGASTLPVNTATKTGSPGNSYTFQASVSLPWWGGKCSVSRSASIPISSPGTPTAINTYLTGGNDRVHLSADFPNPSSARVSQVQVERWSYTEDWKRVLNWNPGTGTHLAWEQSVGANNRYQYRIRTHNSSGNSGWRTDERLSTVPAAPSYVKATKQADGSIVVTWQKNTPSALDGAGFRILDNGTQVGTSPAGTLTWTHVSPSPTVTHTYTVVMTENSRDSSGAVILTSAESAPSNTVQLLAAPNAPGNLSPNGGALAFESTSFRLAWAHNPVDSSGQTSAEYRFRAQGTSTWNTGSVTTDQFVEVSSALFTPGTVYEWQVRTRGAYQPSAEAGFSPWSALATFTLMNTPGASISNPGNDSTVNVSRMTVTWTYFQAQGRAQAGAEVQLVQDPDSDSPITRESRTVSGAKTSLPLTTALADQTTYMVRVRVRSGDGLWSSWDESTFSVSYPQPPVPQAGVSWDDTQGAAQVSVFNPDPLDPATNTRKNLVQNGRAKYTSGTVEVRRNLFPNPVPASVTGWLSQTGWERSFLGSAVRYTKDASGLSTTIGGSASNSSVASVSAGSEYPFLLDVFPSADMSIILQANWRDSSGNNISSVSIGDTVLCPAGVWTPLAGTGVAPSGASYAGVRAYSSTDVPEGTTVDMRHMAVGTDMYFDGSYSPDPDLTPSWTGTENDSESVLTGVVPTGLLQNPNGRRYVSHDSDGSGVITTFTIGTNGGVFSVSGAVTAGQWVGVSGWIYNADNASSVSVLFGRVQNDLSPWGFIAPALITNADMLAATNGFTYVSGAVQVTSSTARFIVHFGTFNDPIGARFMVRDMMVSVADTEAEALAAVQTYFDGDDAPQKVIDGQAYSIKWDGTAGASSSTATPSSPAAVYNTVERSIDGGNTWELVMDGLPLNGTLTDPECLSYGETLYRVSSVSALPSSSTSDASTFDPQDESAWINAGMNFSTSARIPSNLRITRSLGKLNRTLVPIEGREYGMLVEGVAKDHTVTVAGDVPVDVDNPWESDQIIQSLDAIADVTNPAMLRLPDGTRWYGALTSYSRTNPEQDRTATVSIAFERGNRE